MILTGHAALITGGGRGIGATAAAALAKAGAQVSVAARSGDQVDGVAAELRSRGFAAFAFPCDVTDAEQVAGLAESARQAMGRVDILVNNAGTATSSPLRDITLAEWNRLMAVNATGTFLCTQAVFDAMVADGWGRVVNVASVAGLHGDRYIAAYTAAKHAAVGFTRAVAAEAAGTGVTVNAVCPGYVDTPLTDDTIARVMRRAKLSHDDALEAILRHTGQPRLIRPDEVASSIVELCTEQAGDRNGEAVVIDLSDPDVAETQGDRV